MKHCIKIERQINNLCDQMIEIFFVSNGKYESQIRINIVYYSIQRRFLNCRMISLYTGHIKQFTQHTSD